MVAGRELNPRHADFQTHGFHARLFELSCFAYLKSAGLEIDRSVERPDFIVSRGGLSVAIEAVTANTPDDQSNDISVAQMSQLPQSDILAKVIHDFPKRMCNSLRKKSAQRYHAASHVSGKPIVLVIAPCFEAGAGFYPDDAFFYGLYGPPDAEPVWQGRPAFFWQKENRAISSVVYCNAFTVSRFFRLATPLGPNSSIVATRAGAYYTRVSDSESALGTFEFRVGHPGTPKETWSEGVTIFQNPFATVPLPDDYLPRSCVVSVQDGYVSRQVYGFHPISSCMITHVPEGTEDDDSSPKSD